MIVTIAESAPPQPSVQWRPMLVLLLASPFIAELLTSSAPPLVFFNPAAFTLLVLLYGSAAVLIREQVVRWHRGWPSILLLGAGYGIVQEAIAAKTFFDPHWHALGPLGQHGHWLGVNWIWALDLMLFHATFSVALPIMIVYLLFPQRRGRPWLNGWTIGIASSLFLFDLFVFFKKGNPYRAPGHYYVLSLLVVAALYCAARWLPLAIPVRSAVPPKPRWFAALGFAAAAVYTLLIYAFPYSGAPPLLTVAMVIALALISAWLLMKWSGNGDKWSAKHQFGLIVGALGFYALLGFFQEVNTARSDAATGMSLVGLGTIAFLWWMGRFIAQNSSIERQPS